jgi:hypothetical protein
VSTLGAGTQSQEPPGGWYAPPSYPAEAYAVKRGLGRVWAFTLLSFGIYGLYWFYVTRKQLDGEVGQGRDDATLHTLGLVVPILNYFIIYWLWRDLSALRARIGQTQFPAGGYVVGTIFLAPVFYSLVLVKLNEYWDARTRGLATDAPVTTGEKVVLGVGAAFWVLWVLVIVAGIIIAIVAGSSSG